MTTAQQARDRESEANKQRYKHGRAAREWTRLAEQQPEYAPIARALAAWMHKYEEADALAEQTFRALAAAGGGR